MKKLVTILTILVTILITISAYADITDEVYWFYKNEELMNIWKELDDGQILYEDYRVYMKGGNLNEQFWDDSLDQIETNLETYYKELGAKHFDVHVWDRGRTDDGRKILWIEVNGLYDLSNVEPNIDFEFYGFDILCYDRF